jgi:DNA-binding PadR family transcriptional regulator
VTNDATMKRALFDLTPEQEERLQEWLSMTEAELSDQARRVVEEAMSTANVQRFGEAVSAALLPELEATFEAGFAAIYRRQDRLEQALKQAEERIRVLERIVSRSMPVGRTRS